MPQRASDVSCSPVLYGLDDTPAAPELGIADAVVRFRLVGLWAARGRV